MAGDYNRAFQQTVETCALVICLWVCKEEIWDTYTKEEKDVIAEFLRGYADGNTVPQNWRLFTKSGRYGRRFEQHYRCH